MSQAKIGKPEFYPMTQKIEEATIFFPIMAKHSIFLDASSQLDKRLRPSVGPEPFCNKVEIDKAR